MLTAKNAAIIKAMLSINDSNRVKSYITFPLTKSIKIDLFHMLEQDAVQLSPDDFKDIIFLRLPRLRRPWKFRHIRENITEQNLLRRLGKKIPSPAPSRAVHVAPLLELDQNLREKFHRNVLLLRNDILPQRRRIRPMQRQLQ